MESNAVPVSSGPDSITAEFERGDSAQTQEDGGLDGNNMSLIFTFH